MARDQKSDQQLADAPIVTAPPEVDSGSADTKFVTSGPIPPVDTTATTPAPSASDRAFGKTGPGVQALDALIAKGNPKADDVAGLIDAHRDEHDAMLALVEKKLGKASAKLVRKELDGLRASIQRKEIVAGDPGDPNADYLDVSQQLGGAKWRADGGKFTGTANKDGLDTDVKVGAKDDIHAKVKPDKSGTVDWNHDGKTEAELYGNYKDGKDYTVGVKRDDGAFSEGIEHKVEGGKSSDVAHADYKKGDTTAHAEVGLKDGKDEEAVSGATTIGKNDKLTGSASHDASGISADVKDTHDFGNGKTGTLDASYKNGTVAETGTFKSKTDDLTETVSHDKTGTTAEVKDTHDFGNGKTGSLGASYKNGTVAETGTLKTKTDDVSETASYGKDGVSAEVKDTHDFGNGKTGTLDASYKPGSFSETGTYKTKTDDFSETVSHDKTGTNAEVKDTHDFGHGTTASVDVKDTAGALSESASVTHKGAHDTETATIAHDGKGTTGSLDASYENGGTKLDGSVKRDADKWTLHGDASQQINKQLSVSGHVDSTIPDHGKAQTDFGVSESYKTGKVIEGLDLEGGKGSHDYLKATGSVSGQLAPNLYGSGWGSYSYEAGHQNTAQLGASLTFTPQEKQALTLAGLIDEHGRVETRLQYDIFKDKINGISDLDQHKKDAMISIFVSYSQQVGGHRNLDDRFGAPDTFSTPGANTGSQVMAGFRIRF
jgi:hypothetical protein